MQKVIYEVFKSEPHGIFNHHTESKNKIEDHMKNNIKYFPDLQAYIGAALNRRKTEESPESAYLQIDREEEENEEFQSGQKPYNTLDS